MRDLQSRKLMWVKAVLFLVIGVVSVALILIECPEWRMALLLGLAVWSFCRAYYFAFYVIEHYVDPSFRFSGLFSALRYFWTKKTAGDKERDEV
jgi:hypothetical protein